jgi:hypothetical protein
MEASLDIRVTTAAHPTRSSRGADGDDVLTIRVRRSSVVVAALIAAVVLPSLIWCLADLSVWAWDQSSYGDASLKAWAAHRSGASAWLIEMMQALASAPPLIVWLGQFFVPLRHMTGQFESALLLLNVAGDVVILVLIDATARHLGCRLVDRMAAVLLCGGAGIVVSLCHEFLVETLTCASAAFAIYVSVRADRLPALRCIALIILAVSVGLLAKASSGLFLAPLLAYAAVAALLARGRARPSATLLDVALIALACLLAVGAAVWYATNWTAVVDRFIHATVAKDVALFYGSPVDLQRKIPYWIHWLGLSISSFAWMSVGISGLILSSIAVALRRSYDRSIRRWIGRMWEDGLMLALALAGGVVTTIMVFSLQINEDTRFLITTIPMVAVLVGWSLRVLRVRLLSTAVVLCLSVNAVVTHLLGFGLNPLEVAAYGYSHPPDLAGSERELVKEAAGATCPTDLGNRWNIVAVSYKNLNANTAGFYAAQLTFDLDRRCRYGGVGFAPTDLGAAIKGIDEVNPAFVITLDAARQPPADFANRLSKPIAEWLAQYPSYVRVSALSNGFLVYRARTP